MVIFVQIDYYFTQISWNCLVYKYKKGIRLWQIKQQDDKLNL